MIAMGNRCNVEVYQAKINKKYGTEFNILVLYCAQPMAVFCSWIVYKSRAHRDSVNKKVMKDPRMAQMMGKGPMPFGPTRTAYGSFKALPIQKAERR
jgi:uncharacterized protein YbaA (DUF1428 family)